MHESSLNSNLRRLYPSFPRKRESIFVFRIRQEELAPANSWNLQQAVRTDTSRAPIA